MTYQVVSIKDPATIRRILQRVQENDALRREVFKEVARSPQLQRELLTCFAKRRTHHADFILKIAKNLKIRKEIFKLASPKNR